MRTIDADALFINLEGMMEVSPTGYIHGDTIADMISDAPTIEPEPKWIPTKERLPKIGRVVIISVSGVYTAEGYLKDNGDWHVFRFDRPQENKFVDAWMPLPEQYKENK